MNARLSTRRELLRRSAGALLAAGTAGAGAYLLHERAAELRSAVDGPTRWRWLQRVRGTPAATRTQLPNYFATVDFPPSAPRISVATAGIDDCERLVRAAVGGLDPALGLRRFIAPGDRVLIKPNVGFDRPPHVGATTHPEVLRWIIRLCREAGAAEIAVVDNPIEAADACFAKSGIATVLQAEGARLVPVRAGDFGALPETGVTAVPARPAVLAHWPLLLPPLTRATKLIGIAPIKDHNLCSASMTLKNWYGLLGGRRNQLHQAIHEVISDLALLLSPTLVVADATRVMLRNGPTGGRDSDVQPGGQLGRPAVIAAADPVACDAWCYEHLLGRSPTELPYLEQARVKVETAVRAGAIRFGEADWRVYERRGQVVTTQL